MVRQADNSFVCFGAKPDKGFWTCDLDVAGSGEGTPVRELEKGTEKWAVGEGQRTVAVDTGQHRDESAWEMVQTSERRSSRHSSSFVEVSLESALVLVCTCTMIHNSPSALELTPGILFVLFICSFYFPVPSIVFDIAVKKCALPLSEPLVDHQP